MRAQTYRSLVALGGGFGLVVALFAALEFYDGSLSNACTVNAFFSCKAILDSGRTTTLGLQDYAWGILGFVAILVLGAVSERRRKDDRITYLLLAVTSAGVALALYFLYVELVEINALCPVCATAYFFGFVAWVGALGLARRAYRRSHTALEEPPVPA